MSLSTEGMDPLITWEEAMQHAQSHLDQMMAGGGGNWEHHSKVTHIWIEFAAELREENQRVDIEAHRLRGQHQRPILTPTPTSV